MKKLKWVLLVLLCIVGVIVVYNYPKLHLISGYSAKNMSSSVFIGERSFEYTDSIDNGFFPVRLARDLVDVEAKWASASVFGLMERKAVYREGLGSVLINADYDPNEPYLVPQRQKTEVQLPYPYGVLPQKDTLFPEVDYGVLQEVVEAAFDAKDGPEIHTRAILVIYKDRIIAEKYADGFSKDSRLLGWSMTKSLLSTLYGVLVKEGSLHLDAAAPVVDWQNDERKHISISHLLRMSSGLAWDENYTEVSDATRMLFLATDMTVSQVDKELMHEPGTFWNYSSGTSNLLSGILRQQFATHQEYLNFPYTSLIDKIGMHSMVLEADLSGNYVGSSYAWATARDWAKFGLLYLHQGHWNGMQLIDSSWVDYVRTPVLASGKKYGGHFWLNAGGIMPDVPRGVFMANGFQGQRVFIIPSKEMVVVRFGRSETGTVDFNAMLSGILSAIKPE